MQRAALLLTPLFLLMACASGPEGSGSRVAAAGEKAANRNYVVMIEGRNFLFDDEGRPTRFGFSVARNIRAGSVAEAERIAIRNVHDDESLSGSLLNSADDPPRVIVTHVFEVDAFDTAPDHDLGYIFYRDRDSKSP